MNKLVFASVISEIQQSDIFMTVKARICEAPAANLNGARVTEAFIDEIVGNKNRYVGLPLYADVKALTKGDYRRLGHLYDSRTGEFHSTQIGSFYQFEKEKTDDGCALIGYARIAKRNKKLSKAISELFAEGALKFSFEVAVGEYDELDDGTILIDVSDCNYLEGTAIVTFPACEDAVALELVAQQTDAPEGGEKEMDKVMAENVTETTEEVVNLVVAENKPDDEEDRKEEQKKCAEEETPATETAAEEIPAEASEETPAQTAENAAVVVRESHYDTQSISAYDTETGTEVRQTVNVETSVTRVEEDAQIVEADDGVHIAEEADGDTGSDAGAETGGETGGSGTESGGAGSEETPSTEEPSGSADDVVPVDDQKKKTAEQMIAELTEVVTKLAEQVSALSNQVNGQREVAEKKTVTAEANPFVESIQAKGKYSLLEKVPKWSGDTYSLLSK